ncbi:MAG: tetratricopeptide repeat protein [Planctomycetes bacterium]|nr:tetratricopeptide repeat protein [Planctomycetota bacterium]
MKLRNILLLWLLFSGVLVIAYWPALWGEVLWNDDAHITTAADRGADGLKRLWTEPRDDQNYTPLTETAFWVQHKLWGDKTLGYHVVNVVLHAFVAVMVGVVLSQMMVPGAWLAACVFALHPVCVESVAWISELNNVLSGSFYMLALACYLRFSPAVPPAQAITKKIPAAGSAPDGAPAEESGGSIFFYFMAFAFFVAAMLCNVVTATLPAAILLFVWWRHGRLGLGRDVLPAVPMLLVGLCLAAAVVVVERNHATPSAGGTLYLTIVQRFMAAAQALWFYAWTLVWPANLSFVYPRWAPDAHHWRHWIPLAAAVLLLAGLVLLRKRFGRGPLTAVLFFGGTLLPVLGFVTVFPDRYSFVSDQSLYIGGLGIICLFAGGLGSLLRRVQGCLVMIGYAAAVGVIIVLGVLTFWQSATYTDAETLWRATANSNGQAMAAYLNLGFIYQGRANQLAAEGQQEASMEQWRRAEAEFIKARDKDPRNPSPHTHLSLVYSQMGKNYEALNEADAAIKLKETRSQAHLNKVIALSNLGQTIDAIAVCLNALETDPDNYMVYNNLGFLYAQLNRMDEAIVQFRRAIEIAPHYVDGMVNLAVAYSMLQQFDEAAKLFRQAASLRPNDALIYVRLGTVLNEHGKRGEAIVAWKKAIEVSPGSELAKQAQINIDAVELPTQPPVPATNPAPPTTAPATEPARWR